FQTDFLIKQAFKSNKKVAVPRIYGKDMKFHYINSLNDPFELNKWDIREPLEPTPSWTSADGRALMLTPGLAFSKGGGRLGRGGGFYDRYLSEYGNDLTTVGLCFEQQIREDFPVNEHDYLINAVCSNRSFYN
nr:5-formyltetrahydrofolate cyclo-ligase [Spirochaetaceae bacterium]